MNTGRNFQLFKANQRLDAAGDSCRTRLQRVGQQLNYYHHFGATFLRYIRGIGFSTKNSDISAQSTAFAQTFSRPCNNSCLFYCEHSSAILRTSTVLGRAEKHGSLSAGIADDQRPTGIKIDFSAEQSEVIHCPQYFGGLYVLSNVRSAKRSPWSIFTVFVIPI